MIRRLIALALANPLFVWLGLALFVGGGVVAFRALPIEAFPDVSDTKVQVITLYPGRAAEEVEKQVTIPLEVGLSGMPHVVRVFSHTQFGLSFIDITFDDQPTAWFARQLVNERLGGVDLPAGVQPSLGPMSTAIGEIYRFRLEGRDLEPRELRSLEDWVVEKHLKQVPGVADIVSMGGEIKQYEVNPDLGRMRLYRVTLAQLFAALARSNANAGGGYVQRGEQQVLLRSVGLLRSSADIGEIVVAETNGVPVRVRDVAGVRVGAVPPQGIVGYGRDDDAVMGIVLMRQGENPSRVLDALKERIEILNAQVLPKGVRLVPYYDRTWLIARTLRTVFGNLTEGALLVVAVLVAFLSSARAALIVAAVIPLALLATFLGLTGLGIPANLLSLGAMDFGIIVDGAVIVMENIFRRLGAVSDLADRRARLAATLDAAAEVGRPTVFSMVIIIAAHIPIFTLQRHEGRIFAPMAWSVTSALVGSLVASLTIVPLLAFLLLRRNVPHEDNRLVRRAKALYYPLLTRAVAHSGRVLAGSAVVLAASLVLGSRLGTEFLPELNEGAIWINLNLPVSVSVEAARRTMREIQAVVLSVPEVALSVAKFGRPEDGTDPKPISMGEVFVDLKPEKEWRRGVTKADVVAELNGRLGRMPGLEPSFSQPIRDNVLESISQIDGQVVVKIFGDDLPVLQAQARTLLAAIGGVPGVARAFVDREGELPQYVLEVDRARAARYGINVGDVQDLVETALGGRSATELWEGERHYAVAVRLAEPEREVGALKRVLIATADGSQVPLAEVVDFRLTSGAMNISRENGQRVIAVGVFIQGRDMGSVVRDMQARAQSQLHLPAGYTIRWSGEFENQQRAMERLALVVPLSILLIFVLLFDAFKSFRSALLIIGNIPLAMIGGITALWVTGIPLSVSAAIGFIALFGQSVLNGVVMVSHFNDLRAAGLSAEEAVVRGSLTRLRTVLMTTLLAMFGLLPMALSHDIGSETQRPLAVVVIGGLVSATLLTLMVIPSLYRWVAERWPENGKENYGDS